VYIPTIDDPDMLDGFGLVIPWGGGKTAKRAQYGIPSQVQATSRLLNLVPGDNINYKFEGLDGPQGPPGPPGPRGFPGANATGVTANPITHNMSSSTTDGSTATLDVAGSEIELESLTVNSRGNVIEITVYATFVSTAGTTRTVTIRINDDTGASVLYTTPFDISAGATVYQVYTTTHTPGTQSNTYSWDASVDVAGDVTANTRGIILYESYV
jgi:hypothetical protein